ncbi:MAG: hypothetical protein KF819_37105 [Labilithrix sp.]|nr:hypothetical protein [Labilithrix sp.]
MRTCNPSRIGFFARLAALGVVPVVLVSLASDARAQIAGTVNRPIPNVLLLVDTSGSMERMPDNSLPSDNRNPDNPPSFTFPTGVPQNACVPGTPSNPNRWGMLLQALTGNLQPHFSCAEVQRNSPAFINEFRIGGSGGPEPYDANYFLPYHRPLAGAPALPQDACALAPYRLPGAAPGAGIGPDGRAINTPPYTEARSFPPDAFEAVRNQYLTSQYTANAPITIGAPNSCIFDQANDGQLDATRDYIRFGLMTFDNDPRPGVGVTPAANPPVASTVDTINPFDGQWSYVKSPSNPLTLAMGLPAGCTTGSEPFEVGARHVAAPPWEGRMVFFPDPNGTIFDLQRTNEEIQKVLLGTRPYGATPIDGMMEDARDYLWYNAYGPLGTQPGYADPYVNSTCREQYVILLTDGAPNMDLRPACEGAGPPVGICPYPNRAAQVADQMAMALGNRHVKTFVIGFSVNGATGGPTNDGFPAAYNPTTTPPSNNCKSWYAGVGGTPLAMRTACTTGPGMPPAKGSTAEACCQLNEIAYFGSGPAHDIGPFFAETQADLVLSFGRILGGVAKAATTRTLPGYAPVISFSSTNMTADFTASFIPNAQKVWSGEIDRTRSTCSGATPTPQAQSVSAGDSYAENTAAQAVAGERLFVTVKGQVTPAASPGTGNSVDSMRTMRPWTSAATPGYADGIPDFVGQEVFGVDMTLAATADWAEAMDIDNNTCKRSRAPVPGSPTITQIIPGLLKNDCRDVIWGFATATNTSINRGSPSYEFNVRCPGGGGFGAGFCSIGGNGCSTLSPGSCVIPGEVCVPQCSALGAVYRSSPTLVGAPTEFLREEAYRAHAQARSKRRPTLFVNTTDGVLHAFKSLAAAAPASPPFDATGRYEMWAFIPPAVLPKLAGNYPTGQQILLDSTPTVQDIVWERRTSDADFGAANKYHTTLVSGFGAGGGGYYALNVTDVDCGGVDAAPSACHGGGAFTPATAFNQVAANAPGPQFLWQLTDIPTNGPGDPGKPTRTARDGTQLVALFGRESGVPAITTLQVDPDGAGARQIGVAILPGGVDGPPVRNAYCNRAVNGGAPTAFLPTEYDASDAGFRSRPQVRQWGTGGATPCTTGPVPGRGVTIVRADTGEIIRHFGRRQQDVPQRIWPLTIDSPFDSPVIGKPQVYPDAVGSTAQKVFVGDADGTIWRIDVSSPNPANWKVTLFQDLISRDLPSLPTAAQSQPIQIPPVLSVDPAGAIIVNAATGDQENVSANPNDRNYVFSILEERSPAINTLGRSQVKWYRDFVDEGLPGATRVTGPMVVFDRTLYFATYSPQVPAAGSCTNGGAPLLWGMDFNTPNGAANGGGLPRWCPIGSVDALTGACSVPLVARESPVGLYPSLAGAIIPGVTVRATLPCSTATGGIDPATTGASATSFTLSFGATTARSASATGTPQAFRTELTNPLTRPIPKTSANIDAWAFVVD